MFLTLSTKITGIQRGIPIFHMNNISTPMIIDVFGKLMDRIERGTDPSTFLSDAYWFVMGHIWDIKKINKNITMIHVETMKVSCLGIVETSSFEMAFILLIWIITSCNVSSVENQYTSHQYQYFGNIWCTADINWRHGPIVAHTSKMVSFWKTICCLSLNSWALTTWMNDLTFSKRLWVKHLLMKLSE